MIDYNALALFNLVPNCEFAWTGNEWEGLEWLDKRPQPTKEQWEAEKERLIAEQPLEECKAAAQKLLNESDFADLYSVRNTLDNIEEWDNYRNTIRQLRINPIENPVFPNKPQTIWKEIIPIPINESEEPIEEIVTQEEPIINNEETIL